MKLPLLFAALFCTARARRSSCPLHAPSNQLEQRDLQASYSQSSDTLPPTRTSLNLNLILPTITLNTLHRRQGYGTDTYTRTSTIYVYAGQNPPDDVESTTTTTTTTTADGNGILTVYTTVVNYPTTSTTSRPSSSSFTSTRIVTVTTQTWDNPPAQASNTNIPFNAICRPGDSKARYPGSITATPPQRDVIIALFVIFFISLIAWNIILLRDAIYPFKMIAAFYHELGHVLGGIGAGSRLKSLELDVRNGSFTEFDGGATAHPIAAYGLGMFFSVIIGCTYILCGFNTFASKIASFFIGLTLAALVWFANGIFTQLLVVGAIGLMVGFWFIHHALYLKYFVLFIGVIVAFYCIFDLVDDFVFRKTVQCCPMQMELRLGRVGIHRAIAAGWFALTTIFVIGFILIGIHCFRETPHAEFCESQAFLPT